MQPVLSYLCVGGAGCFQRAEAGEHGGLCQVVDDRALDGDLQAARRVKKDVAELGDILLHTTSRVKVAIESPVIYYLTQTTVLACLSALEAAGAAAAHVVENRLCWRLMA